MKTETSKCKCGCGNNVSAKAIFVSGHDTRLRLKLIKRAGGMDKLAELLDLIESYMQRTIGESELAKGIRRIQGS